MLPTGERQVLAFGALQSTKDTVSLLPSASSLHWVFFDQYTALLFDWRQGLTGSNSQSK
jgi:hypothetical protein